MIDNLSAQKCVACRADAPHVTHEEVLEYSKQTPGWQISKDQDLNKLTKTFFFKNWQQAIDFANRVGELAEQEGHHPALLVEWGRVTVQWWTHKIKGLHRNDFIMAAKTETLQG
jgi:4a-hydroxytetrahydrobiopterin dehydratase